MAKSKRFLAAICCSALSFPLMVKSDPARAECHFKVATSIICTDPLNAAMAYKSFGFDSSKTSASYNRQILSESQCAAAYQKNYATVKIRLLANRRVALPSGWVGVSSVTIEHEGINDLYYTATDYLRGTCDKYVPPVITPAMPPPVLGTWPGNDTPADKSPPPSPAPDSNGAAAL